MEQFNLDTWLKDKSRKICTRDGREVEILKTDFRGYKQIIGVVKNGDNKDDEVDQWDGQGCFRGLFGESKYDLFFADEKEELTEFEEQLASILFDREYEGKTNTEDDIEKGMLPYCLAAKEYSSELLDFARKELLKDLPKWKKATKCKEFDKHVCVMDYYTFPFLDTEVNEGDYYIKLEDLKTLPKEE